MDTSLPPLHCDHCGEPISVGAPIVAVNPVDPETGETEIIAAKVVHGECFDAWAEAHGGSG